MAALLTQNQLRSISKASKRKKRKRS